MNVFEADLRQIVLKLNYCVLTFGGHFASGILKINHFGTDLRQNVPK